MYVGMAFVLCGWGMWLGSWLAWAGPVLFVLHIHRWQVLPEERVLVQQFGAEYLDYQRRVRRWL